MGALSVVTAVSGARGCMLCMQCTMHAGGALLQWWRCGCTMENLVCTIVCVCRVCLLCCWCRLTLMLMCSSLSHMSWLHFLAADPRCCSNRVREPLKLQP